MLLYNFWYRKFGIRRMANLVTPTPQKIGTLSLPLTSVLHYTPTDTVSVGIPADDIFVKNAEKIVFVEHITELRSEIGNPKKTPWIPAKHLRDYQRMNRIKIRTLTNPEATFSNPRTFVVVNYAPLQFIKRYTKSFFASYYKWVNIRTTMWKTVNDICNSQPARHHFIRLNLPQVLPSVPALLRLEKDLDRNSLEKLRGNEALDIFDIWKWLGKHRSESPMGNLETKNLDNVNLIIQHFDKWICLNLGLLNAWRAAVEAEEGTEEGFDTRILQKRFLHCLVVLFESRTVVEAITETQEFKDAEEDDEDGVDEDVDIKGISGNKPNVDVKGKVITTTLKPVEEVEIQNEHSDISFSDEMKIFLKEDIEAESKANSLNDEDIEKQLAGLNDIEIAQDEANEDAISAIDLVKVGSPRRPLDQGVIDKANELADMGMLSGGEYKRMLRLANSYKEIPNPFGKGTLEDHLKIDPTDLVITKVNKIPSDGTVIDSSMLKSTLLDFDSRYVGKVLTKDVVGMVTSVQNAGIAVTGYEVEPVEDILNNFEIHTVRVTPSSGQSSTVRFRIPKIDEDGTYIANGVRYNLKKQRGDKHFYQCSNCLHTLEIG